MNTAERARAVRAHRCELKRLGEGMTRVPAMHVGPRKPRSSRGLTYPNQDGDPTPRWAWEAMDKQTHTATYLRRRYGAAYADRQRARWTDFSR